MQVMHRDFTEVVNHLNKFRVELCLTKIFSTLKAGRERMQRATLSKLSEHMLYQQLASQGDNFARLRDQLASEQ